MTVLDGVGLIFTVSLAKSGSVWEDFAQKIIAQCAASKIDIPGFTLSTPLPAVPTGLPFLFLTTTTRGSPYHRFYRPFDGLDVNTYTVDKLRELPFRGLHLPLQGARSALPLLMIGSSRLHRF